VGERRAKDALYAEFAAVGKVLGNPKRLELLDLLAQGPRSVEQLAVAAELGMSTCSAHLQTLRETGLVTTRREGKRIYYSLAGDDVAGLWARLRQVAQQRRPHTELARRAYLGPDDTEAVGTGELRRRLGDGGTLILDVRPATEFESAHLPGAVSIPLEELADRIAELPRDAEIVAYCRGRYCVLAHEAVRLLAAHGLRAKRADEGILEWRLAGIPVHGGAA
jgi:DNA-binding transcriptional ArsR family regulator